VELVLLMMLGFFLLSVRSSDDKRADLKLVELLLAAIFLLFAFGQATGQVGKLRRTASLCSSDQAGIGMPAYGMPAYFPNKNWLGQSTMHHAMARGRP